MAASYRQCVIVQKVCLQAQLDACCMGRIFTDTHAGVCLPDVHEQTVVVTLLVACLQLQLEVRKRCVLHSEIHAGMRRCACLLCMGRHKRDAFRSHMPAAAICLQLQLDRCRQDGGACCMPCM